MSETAIIPPQTQMSLPITTPAVSEWNGYSTKWGILTPIRSRQILDQKFAIAYMYGENVEKVLVANTTHQPLTIKAGTQLAESTPGAVAPMFLTVSMSQRSREKKTKRKKENKSKSSNNMGSKSEKRSQLKKKASSEKENVCACQGRERGSGKGERHRIIKII